MYNDIRIKSNTYFINTNNNPNNSDNGNNVSISQNKYNQVKHHKTNKLMTMDLTCPHKSGKHLMKKKSQIKVDNS